MVSLLLWPLAAMADLSGAWVGDDGGRYYLRQIHSDIYWYGEQNASSPGWANVFFGKIEGDRIKGRWADVPKGRTANAGKLRLSVRQNGNVLIAEEKTGGFGGSRWTREGYRPPRAHMTERPSMRPVPRPLPQARGIKEDCISFNNSTTQMAQINGRWKIVDGNHWMFDFGNNRDEARAALRVIRHYGANQSCFVGRPQPSLAYLLVSGSAPTGQLRGEDCIAFNPRTAQVAQINGRWKIVDGNHWMFDFGNNADEARSALAVIRKHGFSQTCYVGRPNPSFKYMRR